MIISGQRINSLVMKVARRILPWHRSSYSQRGEDLIVQDILNMLGISKPTYLDVGANDPIIYSNTYLFYANGSYGVCVEPNPKLAQKIATKRPKDICLNVGVTVGESSTDSFFLFDNNSLSTFSLEQANFLQQNTQFKLVDEVIVNVVNINFIIQKYFFNSKLNFLSLDCEGLDFQIIENLNLELACPEVICVETVSCSGEKIAVNKRLNLIKLMQEREYVAFADTFINTIFIHKASAAKLNVLPEMYTPFLRAVSF